MLPAREPRIRLVELFTVLSSFGYVGPSRRCWRARGGYEYRARAPLPTTVPPLPGRISLARAPVGPAGTQPRVDSGPMQRSAAPNASLEQSRFLVLLVCLLGLFVIPSMLPGSARGGGADLDLALSAVLLAGIWGVSHRKSFVAIGVALVIPMLATVGFSHPPGRTLAVGALASTLAFISFTTGAVLWRVLREQTVTTDTILGGICVYLLLGLAWALLYSILEELQPGSFGALASPVPLDREDSLLVRDLVDYSVLVLTTLGPEQILPLSRPAKAWTGLEAIVGQLFLAIFIARLVGLHASRQG